MNKKEEYNKNQSEVNSDISNNKIEKRKRTTKVKLYTEEREEIIKELEKKMGLSEEIRGVILNDLENNNELKEYLKNKIQEIRRLYKTGNWNYFVKQHIKDGTEISEISLLKSIYKEEKYKLKTIRKMIEKEGIKKQYSCIFFYKDYDLTEKIKFIQKKKSQ